MPSTSGVFTTGENSDIDTAAELLIAPTIKCVFGILVKADKENAGTIYIGPKGVTADTNDATDGFPLEAGEALFIEVDDSRLVYVIASVENQKQDT